MIHIPEPDMGDCDNCPAIFEIPSHYCEDMKNVPMIKSCPCGFDPMTYIGCIKMEPYKSRSGRFFWE
jgi:hypothetical protein